jgi:hypothetical protein
MMTAPRLLALRLACLVDEDQQWLLSRLASNEQMRVRVLLDQLRDSGLLGDRAALREALSAVQRTPATDPALVASLEHLGHPVWRAFAQLGLESEVQAALAATPSAVSPLLARQVVESMVAQPVPEGWKTVLLPSALGT